MKSRPESSFNYFYSQKAQHAEKGRFSYTNVKKKMDIVSIGRFPFRFMIGLMI